MKIPFTKGSWVDWHRGACQRGGKIYYGDMKREGLVTKVLHKIHRHSKLVKIKQSEEAVSYIASALKHRSAEWWIHFNSEHSVEDGENRGCWKHGAGHGRPPRRFDDVHMAFTGGASWTKMVMCGDWDRCFRPWARFACSHANIEIPFLDDTIKKNFKMVVLPERAPRNEEDLKPCRAGHTESARKGLHCF